MKAGNPLPIRKHVSLRDTRSMKERLEEQKNKLRQASQLYEKQFLNEMVKAMRKTVGVGSSVQKSFSEKLYQGQLDEKYVESWSKTGGVGLANLIYEQIMDRYFPNQPHLKAPQGPIDIHSKKTFKLKSFENIKNSGEALPQLKSKSFYLKPEASLEKESVKAPWSGQIQNIYKTETGENVFEIQHKEASYLSKIIYPGSQEGLKVGDFVSSGQKIGEYNPGLGVMAWNVKEI